MLWAALLATVAVSVRGDTPANCTVNDVLGTWIFHEGSRGHGSSIQCSNVGLDGLRHPRRVELEFPDVATDDMGTVGTWTIIYNQGFEVSIGSRRYFAFSNWTDLPHHKVMSRCHETKPGWAHDIYIRDWSCFIGRKAGSPVQKIHHQRLSAEGDLGRRPFRGNPELVAKINERQKSWKAALYEDWEDLSLLQAIRRMGGENSRVHSRPRPARVTEEDLRATAHLPRSFDWRRRAGQSFVSPIRNQGLPFSWVGGGRDRRG